MRLLSNDAVKSKEIRAILKERDMDHLGPKAVLVERVGASDLKPNELLTDSQIGRLSEMCRQVGLKSSGKKSSLIERLLTFCDDLSFEENVTMDEREEWYNNYELLSARKYSDLRAKRIIAEDLEVEHQFEKATTFLFEVMLKLSIDVKRKDSQADGKILLSNDQSILWDCKSVEKAVNLQDHLESQFDPYLRKEQGRGKHPLAFLVIGPAFTAGFIKLAQKYKARINWDIALITAEGLKHLIDQWQDMEASKPFPIRRLNRTEVINREKADFLLSLT